MRNKKAFFTLLSTQILFALFLIAWALFLGLSVMMFDAPGSEKDPTTLIIFFSIMVYPLGLIAGIVTSWVCYALRKYKWAYIVNCIPLLWILPIVVFWGYAFMS